MATGGSDGAICIWDVVQPTKVAIFERATRSLAFHPSGRQLAAASLEEDVYLWDVDGQDVIAELGGHKDGVTAVAFSPDGKWLATASEDGSLRLWNAENREPVALHELDTPARALCFSPDGTHLFSSNGNTTCYQFAVAQLLEE
jgi:WD40 repeat protein